MKDYLDAKGWLTTAERQRLYELAQATQPNDLILNIGVEHGASMVCLHQGNPEARLLGVDIDMSHYEIGVGETIEADSWDVIRTWDRGPVALAFIDGDHSYYGVLRDTQIAKHVAPGGVLAFHDCIPVDGIAAQLVPGVNLAVNHWLSDNAADWTELASAGSTRIFRRKL